MNGYDCRWIGGHYDHCLYHNKKVDPMECNEDCFEYEVTE